MWLLAKLLAWEPPLDRCGFAPLPLSPDVRSPEVRSPEVVVCRGCACSAAVTKDLVRSPSGNRLGNGYSYFYRLRHENGACVDASAMGTRVRQVHVEGWLGALRL